MPTFAMYCDEDLGGCGHKFEEFRWPREGEPDKCPECGCRNGKGLRQNFSANRPIGITKGEDHATTFGQQAEYNARRLGKEKMAEKFAKKPRKRNLEHLKGLPGMIIPEQPAEPAPLPWWRDGSVPGLQKMEQQLDLKQVRDTDKYIEEGKTT